MMGKVSKDAAEALAGLLFDGMTVMAGGFGLCGIPENLIAAMRAAGGKDLTGISNNCGIDGFGLGVLLENGQIKKMISSYVGENKLFEKLYLSGELELEFNPQGTLAERIRSGGAGIPAFFTKTWVGPPADARATAYLAIVKAFTGDAEGTMIYRKTARNFNPMMATAARVTVAEVEAMVPAGELNPDHIHTPGIFVQRIISVGTGNKRIEFRNTRPRPSA